MKPNIVSNSLVFCFEKIALGLTPWTSLVPSMEISIFLPLYSTVIMFLMQSCYMYNSNRFLKWLTQQHFVSITYIADIKKLAENLASPTYIGSPSTIPSGWLAILTRNGASFTPILRIGTTHTMVALIFFLFLVGRGQLQLPIMIFGALLYLLLPMPSTSTLISFLQNWCNIHRLHIFLPSLQVAFTIFYNIGVAFMASNTSDWDLST